MNRLLIILLCLLVLASVHAQVGENQMPDVTQSKSGGVFYYASQGYNAGDPDILLSIPQFLPQGNSFWQLKYDVLNVRSRIGLKVVTELNRADFNFRYKIPVKVTISKADHSTQTFTTSLEVKYDHTVGSSYKQIDMAEYQDGYKLLVEPVFADLEITSYDPINPSNVTTLSTPQMEIASNAVTLQASIVYEKIEHLNPDYRHSGSNIDVNLIQNDNKIKVCWDPIHGAKEYDLEWTAVERIFTGFGWPRANFESNSSRVTLQDNCYEIPNVFEKVGLLFRVRAKGYTRDDFDNKYIQDWSCSYPTGGCDDFSDVRAMFWSSKIDLAAHEQDSLNWQVVTSYAEDGKRKDVVTYMDGTMRSRQTVTAINSDENVLVAETFYDHQGRPAIQSLPAPVHQDMRLKFRQNFNQSVNGNGYSKTDFDLDNPSCGIIVNPMSDQSGSAHYYSSEFYNNLDPQETFENPHHAYIPQADGYPFVQTEYTADNTGRIARQGGAGPQYQLGSGHETKYYYGVPSQEELDILFGPNVGFANHYKKNMVVDPNGQVSISYLDAKGNTIATALAGKAPAALDQLDSYRPIVLDVDLLQLQPKIKTDPELTAVYNLLVENKAEYIFDYAVLAAQFRDTCMTPNICYDCYYDLDISIINNQCGTVHLDTTVSISEILNAPDSINYECSVNGLSYQIDTSLILEIGSYSIIKTLKVNEAIADAYVEHYINDAQNNCTNKLEEFLLEELALVDTADCNIVCEDLGPNPEDNEAEQGWEEMLCDTMPSSPCEVARNLMLADFMPGGQYAGYGQNYTTSNYPLSILNVNNNFESGTAIINYTQVNYDSDTYVQIGDDLVSPAALTVQQFIENYNEAWADKLIEYHPEYCYLARCESIEASHIFDIDVNAIETFDHAEANGYIDFNEVKALYDADDYSQSPISNIAIPNLPTGMNTGTFYTAFENAITDYQGTGLSILQIAIMSTLCPQASNPQQYLDDPTLLQGLPPSTFNGAVAYNTCIGNTVIPSDLTDEQKDDIWIRYKALYLSLKNKFEYIIRTLHAIDGGCYNECIGQQNFNPFINGFSTLSIGTNDDGNVIPELGYFDNQDQVCDTSYFLLYKDKQKRFPSAYDIMPNMDVDVYDPETPIIEIWQNVIENTDEEYLEGCEPCSIKGIYLTTLNKLIEADYFPNYDMDNHHNHGEMIHSLTDLSEDFSTVDMYYWNPEGIDNWNGIKVVFNNSCEIIFGDNAQLSNSTSTCGFNYIRNPNFEYGEPTNGDQDINNAEGWKAIWEDGSLADFFGTEHHYQTYGIQGNWGGFWVSHSSNVNFREGMMNELNETINSTDGPFNFTLDIAIRSTQSSGEPILSVYGVNNPSNGYSQTPTSKNAPTNLELFGSNKTVHLGDIPVDLPSYNSYVTKDLSFDPSQINMPVEGITHLLFLAKDSHSSGQRFIFIDNLKLCDQSAPSLSNGINSFLDISINQDNSSEIGIIIETTGGGVDTLVASNICDFSCDEETPSSTPSCLTLPEANDFQNFLNSFHWSQTASSGIINNQTNIHNIGTDLQEAIGIDTFQGQYPFATNITLDSIIVTFYDGCDVVLNVGRAASQFGTNQIQQFGHIQADFTQLDADGYADHFMIQYQNKDGQWTTATGYTNGCFHVGYCCPDIVYTEPTSPPRPPIGNPRPWPLTKPTDIKQEKTKTKGIVGKEKNNKNRRSSWFPIPDPDGLSDLVDEAHQQLVLDSIKLAELQQLHCLPCGIEVTGGIWRDTIFGRPCEDVWCRDSIPVIYATDLNSECIDQLYAVAEANAYNRYDQYIDSIRMDVKARYMAQCLETTEIFDGQFAYSQHHFTLYYYDQANNLVQTVPPNGIDTILANVEADMLLMKDYREQQQDYLDGQRANEPSAPNVSRILPSWASEYTYNSLNQLTKQKIPDQGHDDNGTFIKDSTLFWYDNLGRLVASQNPEQEISSEYSYTLYDGLGRIRETGEVISPTLPDGGTQRPIETGYYDDNVITNAGADWENFLSGTRSQITQTTYDKPYHATPPLGFPGLTMDNLRGRVSSAAYYEDFAALQNQQSDFVTHYSYDIHGNVKSLIQKPKDFGHKTIEYNYDLISGNVNYVWYQRDKKDQFTHRYDYDADNRLTLVETSRDGVIWEEDAHYKYYLHGPLARVELGEDEVQGLDYAYTLQGWIKGMNAAASRPDYDIGKDGKAGSYHANFARDEVGFTLNYNQSDYTPSGATPFSFDSDWNSNPMSPELWNGNIRSMITSIRAFMPDGKPAAYSYTYDQLNRIKSMDHHNDFNPTSNTWNTINSSSNYSSSYSYDANGNIQTLQRSGMNNGSQLQMDNFTYNYTDGNNRLEYVNDPTSSANYENDIDNQSPTNYTYDRLGNLTKDEAEDITNISWNLSGKVSEITKGNGDKVTFRYDALGNRIAKSFRDTTTYYIRDASGNTMATYEAKRLNNGIINSLESITWQSANIYGSSRLGQYQPNEMIGGRLYAIPQSPSNSSSLPIERYDFRRGKDKYELTNHLGNVLATVSDRKRFEMDANGESEFVVDVMSANDYYPGGMLMGDKSYQASNYYYKHQGQESDTKVSGEGNSYFYKYRMSDTRLNRFFSVDLLHKIFPYNSAYAYSENRIIDAIEYEGLESVVNADQYESETGEIIEYNQYMDLQYDSEEGGIYTSGTLYNGREVSFYNEEIQVVADRDTRTPIEKGLDYANMKLYSTYRNSFNSIDQSMRSNVVLKYLENAAKPFVDKLNSMTAAGFYAGASVTAVGYKAQGQLGTYSLNENTSGGFVEGSVGKEYFIGSMNGFTVPLKVSGEIGFYIDFGPPKIQGSKWSGEVGNVSSEISLGRFKISSNGSKYKFAFAFKSSKNSVKIKATPNFNFKYYTNQYHLSPQN